MKKSVLFSIAGLAVLFLAGCANSNNINQPQVQNQDSKTQLDLQAKCADMATKYFANKGYKTNDDFDYKNHYNSKLSKCFILISYGDLNTNSLSLDLYDALEGKHYAEYNGHAPATCISDLNKCKLDGGVIWNDGNDTKNPADITVGFKGFMNSNETGNKDTETQFLDQIQPFMND